MFWLSRSQLCVSNMVTSPLIHDPTPLLDLLIVLNFQSPPKNRQRSPPLSPPSPFWMSIKPRLTRARRDSSMAPLSLDRRRGTLECPSPSDSAISSRDQGTDPISARAADLLACPPHFVDKNCLLCPFQPGLTLVPLGTDARHFVRCRKAAPPPWCCAAVSDKVRNELSFILERCGIRTIAERPSSHR
jgi:hypothetical protein